MYVCMYVYIYMYVYICIYMYIYHFDTLDERIGRADKTHIAHLSVRYKKYLTLILINTFHSIIKFL